MIKEFRRVSPKDLLKAKLNNLPWTNKLPRKKRLREKRLRRRRPKLKPRKPRRKPKPNQRPRLLRNLRECNKMKN